MRVSIVSTAAAYPYTDALARLAGLLLRRGDDVRVFTTAGDDLSAYLPDGIVRQPAVAGLHAHPHFGTSDLYVFHATDRLDPLETLLALDRGVVILWAQTEIGSDQAGTVPDGLARLAAASDLVVCDDTTSAGALQRTGAAEPERLHIVPPAVSLAEYAPSPPDAVLRRELGLLGRRVLLVVPPASDTAPPHSACELVASVREKVDSAVLAVAPTPGAMQLAGGAPATTDCVILLPPAQHLRPYYGLADIFVACASDPESRQRVLEARACGLPVLSLGDETEPQADALILLLTDDAAYGEAVRRSLNVAADHSLDVFAQNWGAAIAQACDWLPIRLSPQRREPPSAAPDRDASRSDRVSGNTPAEVAIAIEQLRVMAGVALHDYEVRSPTPIFGPFIAWVRRNLTSHLRRPYIDPILDRQESFNRQAVNALEDLARKLAAVEHTQSLAPSPSPAVDPQVYELLDQMERLLDTLAGDDHSRAQAAVIRSALAQVRDLLQDPAEHSGPLPKG